MAGSRQALKPPEVYAIQIRATAEKPAADMTEVVDILNLIALTGMKHVDPHSQPELR
jgi:hypothetical protein